MNRRKAINTVFMVILGGGVPGVGHVVGPRLVGDQAAGQAAHPPRVGEEILAREGAVHGGRLPEFRL